MGTGIIVCGLNGSGKSTLGKALSETLGFHFIDSEYLFFSKSDLNCTFTSPRSYEEAVTLLLNDIKTYTNFIFAAVKGNYGQEIIPFYQYAVLIEVPKDIRLNRVKSRSFQKFGSRMLPGGDLYDGEEEFFNMVDSRSEYYVEEWIQSLSCPIIRVDGTKPIEENIKFIIEQIQK